MASYASDDAIEYDDATLSEIHDRSIVKGPFGIDPFNFLQFSAYCLSFWLLYLFIPRGYRFTYFGSFPKRYAWSSRFKRRRRQLQQQGYVTTNHHHHNVAGSTVGSLISMDETINTHGTNNMNAGIGTGTGTGTGIHYRGDSSGQSVASTAMSFHSNNSINNNNSSNNNNNTTRPEPIHPPKVPEDEIIDFTSPTTQNAMQQGKKTLHTHLSSNNSLSAQQPPPSNTPFSSAASAFTFNDEIAISTTMQQLREGGVKIIAHGSKGKPKTVRLLLTENSITWRTESSKKKNKIGKEHNVPLTHIMYVDVGKQTTALRRVENASIADNVCLSLLTKDGSLDLEASSSQERDALVNCFSLVLDEIHAQNWRDVYRGPSSDLPSSFDDDMGADSVQRMEV